VVEVEIARNCPCKPLILNGAIGLLSPEMDFYHSLLASVHKMQFSRSMRPDSLPFELRRRPAISSSRLPAVGRHRRPRRPSHPARAARGTSAPAARGGAVRTDNAMRAGLEFCTGLISFFTDGLASGGRKGMKSLNKNRMRR
jgi:hypothetical protein